VKPKLFIWDWKEQPPWEAISQAVASLSRPNIFEVETNCDEYAIVICEGHSREWAQAVCDRWYGEGEMGDDVEVAA
jgi:hypothetical protein